MPKERRLAAPPEIKLPSLELESTGTGLLGLFTGGHARARNAAKQAYLDAVALGMDPAEAARRWGPQIMGPGFVPPKTKAEREAEYGTYKQSLARLAFPEPETREVPTGAYQVEPVLGPQGERLETEFLRPPTPTGAYDVEPPTGAYTDIWGPRQYGPGPSYEFAPELVVPTYGQPGEAYGVRGPEPPPGLPQAIAQGPVREPIEHRRAEPEVVQLPRREPIERQRVIAPEVRPEIFQPPAPTRAQLLAQQLPSQVRTFEQAYAELQEARKADVERQATEALAGRAPPGAPPAPGGPAPAPGAPPTPGAPALSPTDQVEADYEPGIQRLRANPEYLLSDAGKNYLERKAKAMDIAQKREEAQEKRATAESVQRFRTHARQQGDAAEAEGDPERRDFWRAAEANPTQYLPQAKERAERADKAQAKRDQRDLFLGMRDAATDPRQKALFGLAAVHDDTAKEVAQQLAKANEPVKIQGEERLYQFVTTPQGETRLELIPGQPAPKAPEPWKPIKEQFGPDIAAELAGMAGVTPDTVTSEHIRQATEQVEARKETRAKAGAAKVEVGMPQPVKPTQASITTRAGQEARLDLLDDLDRDSAANPDWIGIGGWVNAQKAKAPWLTGGPSKGYVDFASRVDLFAGKELREMAQGALTEFEDARYGAYIPRRHTDLTTPWKIQPAAIFRANVRTTRRYYRLNMAYHQALQEGKSVDEARAQFKKEMEAEYQRATAEAAKLEQTDEVKKERAEIARRAKQFQGAPGPGGPPPGGQAVPAPAPATGEEYLRRKYQRRGPQ
jgi:hypothetical protein